MKIHGDLANVKASVLEAIEALYALSVPTDQISTRELNEAMLAVTDLLDREVAVYVNRAGSIVQVSIGDVGTVDLPKVKARSESRLSGIRCIHTHPSGDTRLSSPDLSSLRRLRFDCMAAIGRDGKDIVGSMGFLTGNSEEDGTLALGQMGPVCDDVLHGVNLTWLIATVNRKLHASRTKGTEDEVERAILAGVAWAGNGSWSHEASMEELARLADTAGAIVVGQCVQRKEKPDAMLFLGKGKVSEIAMEAQDQDATLLIVDDELTPSQQRNLERTLGLKVIDRTALILDIFAQRARSSEGKMQVELAQLRYHLPRLGGQGLALSRLGGGIGTRGPGETKLEMDRRRIRSRIHDIEQQIDRLKRHRTLHRKGRKEARIPLVALVGYTNAGKSTLLNKLTNAAVMAEDKLFATLDPTTRKLVLPSGQEILLTDTVGFIQKLPHTLVTAFRATLEEVQEADLLLHVVDASDENVEQQIESVVHVLTELHAEDKPTLYVWNKMDCLEEGTRTETFLHKRDGVCIAAEKGENLNGLIAHIEAFFRESYVTLTLLIPYADGAAIAALHALHAVRDTAYCEQGTRVCAHIPLSAREQFRAYECARNERDKG